VVDPADEPQPMAVALEWVSRIFAVSAEMILPGLLAKWLGNQWGLPWLILPGFALGICLGLWHLIVMTKTADRRRIEGKISRPDGESKPPDIGRSRDTD
jgi:hypothetical protein